MFKGKNKSGNDAMERLKELMPEDKLKDAKQNEE